MANGHDGTFGAPMPVSSVGGSADAARRFDAFFREQHHALLQFLRRRTASEEDAKDAAQESLIRLLRYRESQPASAWKPLLYRIAINVAGEQFRRARARHATEHVPLDDMDFPSETPAQEELIAQDQQEAWLRAAILDLPPKWRQVYLLSRMRGMSYSQIARHCSISVKTVEKYMSRALAALCERAGTGLGDAL